MSVERTVRDQPRPGPHNTLTTTPILDPGAVRRTMATDATRPDGANGPVCVTISGRDVRAQSNGSMQVLDDVEGEIFVSNQGKVTGTAIDGGDTQVPDLVGMPVARGWSKALAAVALPDRTVLSALLEDLAEAVRVSAYGLLREGLIGPTSTEQARLSAQAQQDVCVGWATGGELITNVLTTGRQAIPYGPEAAQGLVDSPGWHSLGSPTPGTFRRIRRLDVTPAGDGLDVEAHFRDTYTSDDPEMVIHEYLVGATVEAPSRLSWIEVEPRVLPWEACPGAIGSAQQVVGVDVHTLPELARHELRGPTTCTHLTSTLRSIADVAYLSGLLP